MAPFDVLPACIALALALLTSRLIAGSDRLHEEPSRYRSIDGLRGYLAFGVFLCHSTVWSRYRVDGVWAAPDSTLFVNLGKGSVALFFMITAFLFFGRLLEARGRPIQWRRLVVGRIFRLARAYYVTVAAVLLIAAIETGFSRQVPWGALLRQLRDWLGFTFSGAPDINGMKDTAFIVAGVLWSLPYEWLFYLALPLMGVVLRVRVPWGAMLMTLAAVALLVPFRPAPAFLGAFAGGIVAAYAVRWAPLVSAARRPAASVVTAACLVLAFTQFKAIFQPVPLVLLTIAFTLIAAGDDLWGVLSHRVSRLFGEPTYSLYLLHGMVLYVTFKFLIGLPAAASLTPTQHWMVIWAISPLVVVIAHLCFRYVEQPGMALTDRVMQLIGRAPRALAPVA